MQADIVAIRDDAMRHIQYVRTQRLLPNTDRPNQKGTPRPQNEGTHGRERGGFKLRDLGRG
jgi:hypothetical protein